MKTIQMILVFVILIGAGKTEIKAQNEKVKNGVYTECEEMPEYPGGFNALASEIAGTVKYPDEAKKKGIQGKVFVSFVVDETGKITNAKVEKGVDPALDVESIRVLNSLKTWKPGKDKGKAVKVAFTIPIQFKLDDKNNKQG